MEILCVLFIGVLLLSPNVVRAVPTLAPTYKITSVPVPATMAYDSGKGEIYSQYNTISGTGVVAVISDNTNKVIANLTEAQGAAQGYIGDVVYDSGKGEIFAAYGNVHAANEGSTPLISVISDSNNTIKTISWNTPGNSQYNWPAQPTAMVYDSGKGEIFVSDVASYSGVFVMSDQSNAIVATIGVEHSPGEMVYDSAKSEVFVANYNQVSVISDSTNKVVANISVSATSLAYDPTEHEVFAYNGTRISVISDSTNKVVATITGITGGSNTIAYDSAKGEIFAGAVISDSTNTIVAQLPTGIQNIVYDSGKGEIVGTYVPAYYSQGPGIDLFSDSSSATATTTSTSPSSATSSVSASTTSTTSSSSSSSSSGGGSVPEFPYALPAAAVLTILLAVSYLLVRSRAIPKARLGTGTT
ncbi:MAG: hypothetical protein ABSB29_09785 [Nitrososphaerales archaeon]